MFGCEKHVLIGTRTLKHRAIFARRDDFVLLEHEKKYIFSYSKKHKSRTRKEIKKITCHKFSTRKRYPKKPKISLGSGMELMLCVQFWHEIDVNWATFSNTQNSSPYWYSRDCDVAYHFIICFHDVFQSHLSLVWTFDVQYFVSCVCGYGKNTPVLKHHKICQKVSWGNTR